MKTMRRVMFWFVLCLLTLSLWGCRSEDSSGSASTEEVNEEAEENTTVILSMGSSGDWSSSFKGSLMEDALDALEESTGGEMKIEVYDRSRLGDDTHLASGVQIGTIDILQSSPLAQINAVPEAALFDLPGLFDSLEEWNALYEGDYRSTIEKYYRAQGLVLLDICAYSWRQLSSREPVSSVEDLQGLRVRTVVNQYQEIFWNSLGAVAMPGQYAELYFSLYEGLVDAQENMLDVMISKNLYEMLGYVTYTYHMPMTAVFAMNLDKYNQLTEEQKEALIGFAGNLREMLLEQMPEEEARLEETLDNDYGVTFLQADEELREAFRRGMEEVVVQLRVDLGDGKVDAFLAAAEAVRSPE